MARDPLVCDDPLAERRFAYAKAAADEGDFNAAAEVLEQALERAPDWAAAWFALGEARERLGEIDAAASAFRSTLAPTPPTRSAPLAGRADRARRRAAFPSRGLCRPSVRSICAALRSASDRDARLPRPRPHRRSHERRRAGPPLRLGPGYRLRRRAHGRGFARPRRPSDRRRPFAGHDREGAGARRLRRARCRRRLGAL